MSCPRIGVDQLPGQISISARNFSSTNTVCEGLLSVFQTHTMSVFRPKFSVILSGFRTFPVTSSVRSHICGCRRNFACPCSELKKIQADRQIVPFLLSMENYSVTKVRAKRVGGYILRDFGSRRQLRFALVDREMSHICVKLFNRQQPEPDVLEHSCHRSAVVRSCSCLTLLLGLLYPFRRQIKQDLVILLNLQMIFVQQLLEARRTHSRYFV